MGIIAGAMQGAGEAGVKAGLEYQKQAGAMELQKVRDQSHLDRETTLQRMRDQSARSMELEVRQPFEQGQQTQRIEADDKRTDKTIGADDRRTDKTIAANADLQKVRQTFEADQHELNRNLTREQIAAQKSIAASNNGIALQIAKLGGAASQDKEGNMIWVSKDGTAKQIMDPSNPDQPLKGFRDLSPAAKAMLEIRKAELIGLNKIEADSVGDQAALDKIGKRRAEINANILNIATTGIESLSHEGRPAATGAKWDDGTGNVILGGKVIGRAKTEAEARSIASSARETSGSGERPALSAFDGVSANLNRKDGQASVIKDPYADGAKPNGKDEQPVLEQPASRLSNGYGSPAEPDQRPGAVARSIANSAESRRGIINDSITEHRSKMALQSQFDEDKISMAPADLVKKYEPQSGRLTAFQRGSLNHALEKVMDKEGR